MNLDYLITNIDILGWTDDLPVLCRGVIGLANGRIELVDTAREEDTDQPPAASFPASLRAQQIIDGTGMLAMPGMVNLHTHAAMTLFRGMADDLQLGEWLNDHIFPAEARFVNPEMVYWCSRLAAAEMILAGTTTVADGYFLEGEAARAFLDVGMRAIPAQGVIDFPAPGAPDPSRNIEVAAKYLADWQERSPLITPAVFAHSPYTCSNRTIRAAKELASRFDAPLFIHVAETREESAMIGERLGPTPVRHLQALGVLDMRTVCVHCVWCDEEDLDILAAHGCLVVSCPQSNMKLASGIAPVTAMLERDIRLGLGTDGAASNNSLDLFREMNLGAKLQNMARKDDLPPLASCLLSMASGRSAALPDGPRGLLEPGSPADLVLIDLTRPHLQPFSGTDLLVDGVRGSDVQTVFINGRMVMHEREILSFDLEECLERVRYLAANIS